MENRKNFTSLKAGIQSQDIRRTRNLAMQEKIKEIPKMRECPTPAEGGNKGVIDLQDSGHT